MTGGPEIARPVTGPCEFAAPGAADKQAVKSSETIHATPINLRIETFFDTNAPQIN
jgi:hypothetical protein